MSGWLVVILPLLLGINCWLLCGYFDGMGHPVLRDRRAVSGHGFLVS